MTPFHDFGNFAPALSAGVEHRVHDAWPAPKAVGELCRASVCRSDASQEEEDMTSPTQCCYTGVQHQTRRPWRPWEDDEPYALRPASFPSVGTSALNPENDDIDVDELDDDMMDLSDPECPPEDPLVRIPVWHPIKPSRSISVVDLTRDLSPLSDLSEPLTTPPLSPSLSSVASPRIHLVPPHPEAQERPDRQTGEREQDQAHSTSTVSAEPILEPPLSSNKNPTKTKSSPKRPKGRVECITEGCHETFNRVQDMMRHVRNSKAHSTGEQNGFVCEACSKSFPRKDSYRRHLKIKHREP